IADAHEMDLPTNREEDGTPIGREGHARVAALLGDEVLGFVERHRRREHTLGVGLHVVEAELAHGVGAPHVREEAPVIRDAGAQATARRKYRELASATIEAHDLPSA